MADAEQGRLDPDDDDDDDAAAATAGDAADDDDEAVDETSGNIIFERWRWFSEFLLLFEEPLFTCWGVLGVLEYQNN